MPKTYTFKGVTKTLSEWAHDPQVSALGISVGLLNGRYKHGWSADLALTKRPNKYAKSSAAFLQPDALMPDIPPMPLLKAPASIDDLLERARQEHVRNDSVARAKRIHELKTEHINESKVIESWNARMAVVTKQRDDAIKKREELARFQAHIAAAEYASAKQALEADIAALTNAQDNLHHGISAHERRAKVMLAELQSLTGVAVPTRVPIPTPTLQPAPVSIPTMSDPFEEPINVADCHRFINDGIGPDWELVRSLRAEINVQCDEASQYGMAGYLDVVYRTVCALAGRQRALEEKLVDPLAKKAAFFIGRRFCVVFHEFLKEKEKYWVDPMDRSPGKQRDWDAYVVVQEQQLRAAIEKAKSNPPVIKKYAPPIQPLTRNTIKDVAECHKSANEESEALAAELSKHVREFKLAVYGGYLTKACELTEYLEERCKFARVKYFENPNSCIDSIKAGGVDAVLLVTSGIGHKDSLPVTNAAKGKIAVITVNGMGKEECARALLKATAGGCQRMKREGTDCASLALLAPSRRR